MKKFTLPYSFLKKCFGRALLWLGALTIISCSPKVQVVQEGQPVSADHSSNPPAEFERIATMTDSLVGLFIESGQVPGMVVAIAKNGQPVFSRAYGKADVEIDADASLETVFGIASVTKQFTAAAILRLVEEGRLSLSDPITKYLPDYPVQGHQVSIHHLLSHTSGIGDYRFRNEALPDWYRLDLSYEKMVELWGHQPFDFKPGEGFGYSNMGYYLLGQIIERVTGIKWVEYAGPALLQPLGLQHTLFNEARRVIPNRAEGYLHDGNKLINLPFRSIHLFSAGGGLSSTTGDLLRWTHLLYQGKVVSPESLQQMTSPTVLTNGDTVGYGYGLYVSELGAHRKIYHGGTFGFGAFLSHYPEEGLSIGILSNSSKGRERAEQLEKVLAREIFNIRLLDLPLTSEEISRYQGIYSYLSEERSYDLHVFGENGQLKARIEGGDSFRLLYQGSHTFVPIVDEDDRLVFSPESGRAGGFMHHEGRWEVSPAKRKLPENSK
ncbi:serine hydrolase domain-containing protein [Nafulsella turpanensis]|uniref:serine hydrolase domain-containing protein n=1 Tax=Nafulsella turpanensis TaxID=1265690 RepID=UPI0004770C56|nr:serine hydrolase domain-containing protein [Nafulsella turpanensis]